MSDTNFYRAFENKFRGSRELIKSRLEQYLPFVKPLSEIYTDARTFDVGCGRGEWLQLMKKHGFKSFGVDLDQGMLDACDELNLDASQGNAIEYLKGLDSDSQVIVSAFHVVEHILFEDLQCLVREALRVLKPGGLLIMETPNPENIKVASENFYLDPTHIKPIPAMLLEFIPEYYGYYRTKVVRLQEPSEYINREKLSLSEVINGVSPDYAVIAQKSADNEILKLFDSIYSADFGLSIESATAKFESRLINIESKLLKATEKSIEAQDKADKSEAKVIDAEAKVI
ncbi:class I SAM-dependent methyltransferase, partial [Vibrio sp. 10N.261.51.F11]|uniref:class I SAM-dependent methyltransferase n=1 Tax=Vibrio sp. 10N.261.51.F11 TaxID=3229678 RepID=UPI00355192A1